jgi:hypothetical protein
LAKPLTDSYFNPANNTHPVNALTATHGMIAKVGVVGQLAIEHVARLQMVQSGFLLAPEVTLKGATRHPANHNMVSWSSLFQLQTLYSSRIAVSWLTCSSALLLSLQQLLADRAHETQTIKGP